MSLISALSLDQPVPSPTICFLKARSVESSSRSTELRPESPSTPIHTTSNSNLFDRDNQSSHVDRKELLDRLVEQRSKVLHFYDREIELSQSTPRLTSALNQIDQILDEFTKGKSTEMKERNRISSNDEMTPPNKHLTEEKYHSYLNGMEYPPVLSDVDLSDLLEEQTATPSIQISEVMEEQTATQSIKISDDVEEQAATPSIQICEVMEEQTATPSIQISEGMEEQTAAQWITISDDIEEQENPEPAATTDYNDHSYSKVDRFTVVQSKKSTTLQLKRFRYDGCCPLTTRTYGLDPIKHGIRHFPCTRVTAPINPYKHLVQYHQLNHAPTMRIVRLLADENEEGDIDLFSTQSSNLIATHPTAYRAQCPLNQYGKFGITPEHRIRLCTQPNQPIGAPMMTPRDVCLYDHFVVYHQMKRSCAQRLAAAIVNQKNDPIFLPDEQLLNETFYVQCPLRNPKAICWKSPISSRHMGQHLTGIHKLNHAERRQIMTTLRKP